MLRSGWWFFGFVINLGLRDRLGSLELIDLAAFGDLSANCILAVLVGAGAGLLYVLYVLYEILYVLGEHSPCCIISHPGGCPHNRFSGHVLSPVHFRAKLTVNLVVLH